MGGGGDSSPRPPPQFPTREEISLPWQRRCCRNGIVSAARRAFEKKRLFMMVVLMIVGGVLAGSLTACSTTNLSPQAKLATPSGTYAVTITAEQVGSQTINLANGSVEIYGSQNQVSLPFYVNLTVQ